MEDNAIFNKELQPGITLCGGKYTIEKKIGEGGFGITYKAIQTGLNRKVCIKEYFLAGYCVRNTHSRTIQVQGATDNRFEKYRQAFVKEAKILAALNHPNIVEVIDVFDENNTSYMVMPFIEGESLQSIVETKGRLPYHDVVNYIAQVSNAVGYIHKLNILHRDIKPDNIMITAGYKAILIDFGSARQFEHDKTQMHTSMLTHGYAPTEQYTSNSRKGAYTDIYALGATMYFLVTGEVPLEAAARLTETMPEPEDLVPNIPEEANRTILKAMQLKAENRHQSIQEFMDDLRNVRPSELIDETIGGTTSNRKLWIFISLVICILAAVAFVLNLEDSDVDSEERLTNYETVDFTGTGMYPMIKVEGGEYMMGGGDAYDDPVHKVKVSDFYIGQFEVSQALWEEIMGYNPSESNLSGDYPVENITYYDAQEFVDRLNSITGKNFSLPTEAQWEYAARGGKKSEGHIYATQLGLYSNAIYYGNVDAPISVNLRIKDNENRFINSLGLYHMSGNVAEWCLDYYDENFYFESENILNPINKRISSYNVVRGGSYESDREFITVYTRDCLEPSSKSGEIGFRLVLNE